MQATSRQQGGWGNATLHFDLPGVQLSLSGLHDSQAAALRQHYASFLTAVPNDASQTLRCCATRLLQPLPFNNAELTCHGQYAPRSELNIDGSAINLWGINFAATVPLGPAVNGQLAVQNVADLAQANVIENYLRVLVAHQALHHGGLLLHSAAVVADGQVLVFVGCSNAGKTTLVRKAVAAGYQVMGDDINLLMPNAAGDFSACPVPFTGEFGRHPAQLGGNSDALPVAGIVALSPGQLLRVEPLAIAAAASRLLVCSPFVNNGVACGDLLLQRVADISATLPTLTLQSRREDDFPEILSALSDGLDGFRLAA